jgi:hypothetical protein
MGPNEGIASRYFGRWIRHVDPTRYWNRLLHGECPSVLWQSAYPDCCRVDLVVLPEL